MMTMALAIPPVPAAMTSSSVVTAASAAAARIRRGAAPAPAPSTETLPSSSVPLAAPSTSTAASGTIATSAAPVAAPATSPSPPVGRTAAVVRARPWFTLTTSWLRPPLRVVIDNAVFLPLPHQERIPVDDPDDGAADIVARPPPTIAPTARVVRAIRAARLALSS